MKLYFTWYNFFDILIYNKKIQNIRFFQNFEYLCYNLISNKTYFLGCTNGK